MKIIIAPNALKGSLSAPDAAEIMQACIKRVLPDAETLLLPVSDGGDGLLQIFETMIEARRVTHSVSDPLGRPIRAYFLYSETQQLAVIEMAQAAGIALLDSSELDAMNATSHGVGELILKALDRGASRIILGIGGSASCDGGTGMLCALGARLLDADGNRLSGNGAALQKIRSIELEALDHRLARVTIQVACDVDNPLLGETGAAKVFAPQKGASPAQVDSLERGLANLAEIIEREYNMDVRTLPGGGAAGGMGAVLAACLQAKLEPGAEFVLQQNGFDQALHGADLVLTAEGRLDAQSCFGKATAVVARHAHASAVPCYAIGGSIGDDADALYALGIDAMFSLCEDTMLQDECIKKVRVLLAHTTEQAIRYFLSSNPERH